MNTENQTLIPDRGRSAEGACYAYYKRPVKTPDGYWKYRRGGYDPKDGTYGRCWARSEAMDIIRHNAPESSRTEPKIP